MVGNSGKWYEDLLTIYHNYLESYELVRIEINAKAGGY